MPRPVSVYGVAIDPNSRPPRRTMMGAVAKRVSKRLENVRKSSSFIVSERAINKAAKEAAKIREKKLYTAATPLHFVALFMIDYHKIYGDVFTQLVECDTIEQAKSSRKFRRLAVIAINKLLAASFCVERDDGGESEPDMVAFAAFYDWCIQRERRNVEWSRTTGHTYTKMHWRVIFSADYKFTQWSLELRRMGQQIPFSNLEA